MERGIRKEKKKEKKGKRKKREKKSTFSALCNRVKIVRLKTPFVPSDTSMNGVQKWSELWEK